MVENEGGNNHVSEADREREKAINDWLPITSDRNAKWWYSAFHNVTAMVGAGVLSLPYAMSELGWGPGVTMLVMSWGVQPDVDYSYKASTTAGKVFNFLAAMGDVAFAYAGHNVVLEIQATIPSTPDKPSKIAMWKGVVVAYLIVAFCYFTVGFIGYWAYGNAVADNILIILEKPAWLIAVANMFVVIHVVGAYQVYAMPVFDMIESLLVKKLRFTPCLRLRLISRSIYVGKYIYYIYTPKSQLIATYCSN
ncbi:Amino acid transporter, transmembrane [Corchorus capsularis]|uniref:Amino acid transporter, transmembrane n=1 Tax=Corchorus capsularis TaxID=210143 RepID=A0A1R3GQR0_COCAP|nr:Amino acid transporter, transmembrane [Corchorus capsularis]